MTKNNIFKLFSLFSNSYFTVEEGKVYQAGTADDCDIFIDCDCSLLFSFMLSDNVLKFLYFDASITLNGLLETNQEYTLPKIFTINNLEMGIGSAEELERAFVKQHETNNGELDAHLIGLDTDEENNQAVQDIEEDDFVRLNEDEQDNHEDLDDGMVDSDLSLLDEQNNKVARQNKLETEPLYLPENKALRIVYQAFYQARNLLVNNKQLGRKLLKIKLYWIILAILVLVSICGVAIFKTFYHKRMVENIETESPKQLSISRKELVRILSSFNMSLPIRESDEIIVLNGMVRTNQDLANLKQILKNNQLDKYVLVNTLVFNNIESNIVKILYNNKMESSVSLSFDPNTSTINVTGFTNNPDVVDIISYQISLKYPTIEQVDYGNLFSLNDLTNGINEAVESFIAKDQIQITYNLNKYQISVSGYLDENEKNILAQKLEQINTRYDNMLHFIYDIKSPDNLISVEISQVNLMPPAYVITNNGDVIFEGGQINGYTLSKITRTRLFFSGKINFSINIINNNFGNNSSSSNHSETNRQMILQEEYTKESLAIERYRNKLSELNQIMHAPINPKLRATIADDVKSMHNDLVELEKNHSELNMEISSNAQ